MFVTNLLPAPQSTVCRQIADKADWLSIGAIDWEWLVVYRIVMENCNETIKVERNSLLIVIAKARVW
jgi:hypothetical protein